MAHIKIGFITDKISQQAASHKDINIVTDQVAQ